MWHRRYVVLIAQRVLLDDVIAGLQRTRAVFHSEADVQHAFAIEVGRSVADLRVRLEVPFRGGRIDLPGRPRVGPGDG